MVIFSSWVGSFTFAHIKNLFFAGRNISVTHSALSSTRVMATCALLGQAAGTAAYVAAKNGVLPKEIYQNKKLLKDLQDILQDNDCFLPYIKREVSALTKLAEINNINDGDNKNNKNNKNNKDNKNEIYEVLRNSEPRKHHYIFEQKRGRYYYRIREVFIFAQNHRECHSEINKKRVP